MKASFSSRNIQLISVTVLLASIGLIENQLILRKDIQLIIDPTFVFSTYLGGTGADTAINI